MELIVFVGLPGSGKSTYFRERFAATHVHVSKDLMSPSNRRKDERQRELIVAALSAGKSVVVDNTNATRAERAPLVALGRQHRARVIAYWFPATTRECVARNATREGRAKVPNVAIFAIAKKLEPPSLDEGFDEVIAVGRRRSGPRAVRKSD